MPTSFIKASYKEIFQSYDNRPSVEKHIDKLIELDPYLPYNSTFFCITNTQELTFEYVSKNLTACLGLDRETLKAGGMNMFWKRMHPDDLEQWLSALNHLMEFTLSEIATEDREKMSYTWNYRLKNAKGEYVNIIQNTTPLEFDAFNKPIIGLAHYTVLDSKIYMEICASAKMLNANNEYETKYFSNFSKKLLSDGVSNRERDVIRLLMLKHTSKEIAAKLGISHNTVDTHRRNIMKKLNVSSTGELIGLLKGNKYFI
ncbi:LuxR C-terminal-related transcriptional regulator [Tamlana sp. 62-3]|uniref:LuxR C-terminal-related transcriptional regulator n=1 Tax=Neotamlana sargassicola TaxID=2883125 RepID=A0A9X1I6H6_9FLAO|nr:LuxR C-terminal-related transcriptional regulator [Tamlana sargassicola]MCB4807674.1 LuxR C-terminal-related transcriptional regulator [Tamlana sargassicola]